MILVDLDVLKSVVADHKSQVNKIEDEKKQVQDKVALLQEEKRKLEEEQSILGNLFQDENKKKDTIVDKNSELFELKEKFVQKVLENLREKNAEIEEKDTEIKGKDAEIQEKEEQIKVIKEKAQNEIDKIKKNLEENKEELAKKALYAQEKKKSLKKEKEHFESLIRNDQENPTIKNDDQIMQNRIKRFSEIEQEIITVDSQFSDCIKGMDDIESKLEFINYDKIQDLKTDKEIMEERLAREAQEILEEEIRKREEEERLAKEAEERLIWEEQQREEAENEARRAQQATEDAIHEEKAKRREEEARLAREAQEREEARLALEEQQREYEENLALKAQQAEEKRRADENSAWKIQQMEDTEHIEEKDYAKIEEERHVKEANHRRKAQQRDKDNFGSRKMLIDINEKNDMMHIINSNDGNTYNIPNTLKNKKQLFKRLNIKDMCKDIAGKGIASMILYGKINPSIIQGLEVMGNDPNLIKKYISAIHNGEELPFDLQHDLQGINILKKFKLRKFTKPEQKSGALIKGKILNGIRALTSGKGNKKETSASEFETLMSEVDRMDNLSNDDYLTLSNGNIPDRNKFAQQIQKDIDNSDGQVEQAAAKSASEKAAKANTNRTQDDIIK